MNPLANVEEVVITAKPFAATILVTGFDRVVEEPTALIIPIHVPQVLILVVHRSSEARGVHAFLVVCLDEDDVILCESKVKGTHATNKSNNPVPLLATIFVNPRFCFPDGPHESRTRDGGDSG